MMLSTALSLLLATASNIYTVAALTSTGDVDIRYINHEVRGEDYRRLLEPMNQFIPTATICASSQV